MEPQYLFSAQGATFHCSLPKRCILVFSDIVMALVYIMSFEIWQRYEIKVGHTRCLRYHTDSCHFSFPWLSLRFKLTFLATWGPCGSCKAQMSSWGNVAHILFYLTDMWFWDKGSWQLSCRSSCSFELVISGYVGSSQSFSFTSRKIR